MNPITKLFDETYVRRLFTERVLPKYPRYSAIGTVRLIPHKNHVWTETYHVIIEFQTELVAAGKKNNVIPIFCTAHSSEPRINVYRGLKFLRSHGFNRNWLLAPRPLFYSKEMRAAFYRGLEGESLYSLLSRGDRTAIEDTVVRATAWLAKLHAINPETTPPLNAQNSRISCALPGSAHIIERIGHAFPEKKDLVKRIYDRLISREDDFHGMSEKLWYVHGDFHPENIIRINENKLGVIDFADLCRSDFARDLGCFLKQFAYMAKKYIEDQAFIDRTSADFLSTYEKLSGTTIDDAVRARIETYYNWTALRNAVYFALRHNPKPDQARSMIDRVAQRMGI